MSVAVCVTVGFPNHGIINWPRIVMMSNNIELMTNVMLVNWHLVEFGNAGH